MEPEQLLLRFSLLTLACLALADWRQQYGDYRSRNFVEIDPANGALNITGTWNYTNPNKYSIFYQSPCVSEIGVMFIPFLSHEEYDLQIHALAPNGSLLWTATNVVGYSEIMCATVFLTNAAYHKDRNMVVVGWTCASAFPYFKRHGGLLGLDSRTGEKMWRSPNLTAANDLSRISLSSNVAYTSGGYDCWKDPLMFVRNPRYADLDSTGDRSSQTQTNISQIYAISLDDGKLLWTMNHTAVGCTSQTKIYPFENGTHLVIIPAELPRTYYLGGKLLALQCDPNGSCVEKWINPIGVCFESTYAFSNQNVLFGGLGFDGDPYTIFGINSNTGETIFKSVGYCPPGSYPSGPSVDDTGQAYYSCGNRVFAVDGNGKLLWKTDIAKNSSGYTFNSYLRFSPAIVPTPDNEKLNASGFLVVVDTKSTKIFALSLADGSIIGSYTLPVLENDDKGLIEPPLVVGDRLLWLRAESSYLKSYVFSAPIEHLLQNNDKF